MRSIYNNGTYLNNHKDWHLNDSNWKANKIKAIFDSNGLTPKTISEIGCGAGGILLSLNEKIKDCRFTGYEISTDAFDICSKKSHKNVNFIFDNGTNKTNDKNDVVLVIDVIEHIENYLDFLRNLKNSDLYTNFVFHIPLDMSALSVLRGSPIINSRVDSGHIHYFTKDIALEALKECNFEIIEWRYTYSSIEINYPTWTSKLLKFPRRLLYKLNPNLAVRALGGASLMVLAK
jgi:cyclopropane fatty-acyl-phospholipid synthase-like methyltransferase